MSIMKKMGVNSFRTSHNPPSPEMIDVCNRLGITMLVEAFDAWISQKNSQDYHLYFNQWSDYDIKEMVNQAKNAPSVIMWSIGNEIPGFTATTAPPIEKRLVDDIHSIDTTRPVISGSNAYGSVPATGSTAETVLNGLDGLGLNYNTAKNLDGMHAKYPSKIFFYSESSSETSTRGYYQDPDQVNTGPNYTPGKHQVSSYGNNFSTWPLPNEYGLKYDRDHPAFAGQYIWTGMDYIGEPTPYSVFPVKGSFFGAVDTAGFPKDAFYIFQSQWTSKPMVHLVPMNWTDWKPGEAVTVFAYTNAKSVDLQLNGVSLGEKAFDEKTAADGTKYLETSECSNDDKAFTTGTTCPGSYTSPNGGVGKLHLTWKVPFAPGTLVAVAKDASGNVVARDQIATAGDPYTLQVTPDKNVLLNDGKALSYLETNVVDKDGSIVSGASNNVKFTVTGAGTFQGADNGKEDDAEGYKPVTHDAFNGKVLGIVQSTNDTGPIHVTVSADGLLPVNLTLYSTDLTGTAAVAAEPVELRTLAGTAPALPSTVSVLHADNSSESLPVKWDALPAGAQPGVYTLNGVLTGSSLPAKAVVTVYRHASIASYSTAIAAGSSPLLPPRVRVVDSDGVSQFVPVTWNAPASYATVGTVSIPGTIAGSSLQALATVRVTDTAVAAQNLARSTSPAKPVADASYTGSNNSLPAAMLDGTTASGGWTNRYSIAATSLLPTITKAHATDWVSVGWPTPQHFGAINAYFTTNTNSQLPASVVVSYWNGAAWVPVTNQQVTWATASNTPSAITFDPVSATKVKLDMTSASPGSSTTGNELISELQVMGDQVALSSNAALSSVAVDGRPVPGFDPATFSYLNVGGDPVNPVVTATAADNGTVLIQPPASVPGVATITVTSEDGTTSKTYTLNLVPTSTSTPGGAGGTVPATLALTLGAPASFGAFTPGVAKDYTATTTANVISTAGDATLWVSDPGHLTNGTFSLPSALQVAFSKSTWSAPVSNDPVTITFTQHIGATDALRTGSYAKTLTFTLSTTTP